MMHPHLPSPRQLAVPGIGFPQNLSVGPEVLDLTGFSRLVGRPVCCPNATD